MEPSTSSFVSASEDVALDDFPVGIAATATAADNNHELSPPSSSTFENELSDVIGIANTKEEQKVDGDGHGSNNNNNNNNADKGTSFDPSTTSVPPDEASTNPSSTLTNIRPIHAGYTYTGDGADVILSYRSPPYKKIMYEAFCNLGLQASREMENRVADEVFNALQKVDAGGTNEEEGETVLKTRRFLKARNRSIHQTKVVNNKIALESELPHAMHYSTTSFFHCWCVIMSIPIYIDLFIFLNTQKSVETFI